MSLEIPGMAQTSSLFSVAHPALARQQKPAPEKAITEAAIESATGDFAAQQLRAEAMGVALAWTEMENPLLDDLQVICEGVASFSDDSDEDLTDEDLHRYSGLMQELEGVFESVGGTDANISATLSGDEDAAETLGEHLSGLIGESSKSSDEMVAAYAVQPALIGEALVRRVVDGELKYVRTDRKKRRMSAKQKAALKAARRKANSSAAKLARAKSMKMRKQRGL